MEIYRPFSERTKKNSRKVSFEIQPDYRKFVRTAKEKFDELYKAKKVS